MSTKSGNKVRKKTVAIFISGVAAVTAWILIATLLFDAPLRLIIATQQDGYQYEEYQESGDPQYPSYADNDSYEYGETENDDYEYGEADNDDYGYVEAENDDYGYGETENENDDYGYGETENENNDYGYGDNDDANDCKCECYDECNDECYCDCDYSVSDENDDAGDCTCECYDECDEDCDCKCDDCNENDTVLPPGGNFPELDLQELDARITYLTEQVSYYQMQLLLLNNRLFELNIQLIAARGAANQSTINVLELEIAYITAQIDEKDKHLRELEERLAHYKYLRDGVVVQLPCPEAEALLRQLLYDMQRYYQQIQYLTSYIEAFAARIVQLDEDRAASDCGYEWEYFDEQLYALQKESFGLTSQVESLVLQVQEFIQQQVRAFTNIQPARASSFAAARQEAPPADIDYAQSQLGDLHTDIYELEDLLAYSLALLEGIVGIMPLSGPGIFTPSGILALPGTITWLEATNETELRAALNNTAALRVIRLMNDITLTTAAVLPHAAASSTVHIYSNTDTGSFAINRGTSTSRHFSMVGTRVLHLWNVRLTRAPGPMQTVGEVSDQGYVVHVQRITPGGPSHYGGGILMDAAGTRLHMHEGSEISHGRASGRGGGISVAAGIATLNAGALIYSNASNHASAAGAASGGGGGVSISNGATVNVNGATISNNAALRGHGGGIQIAAGTTGGRANININGIQLLNNSAHLNAAGTQGGNGGGIHSNTNATFTMDGVIIIEGNRANNGGAMRVFSGDAANFNLAAGSRISRNIATQNGAGFSIAHSGTAATDSNANAIGLRINGTAGNPVIFEGNVANGIGGAIHHEGPNMDAARGIHISNAIFRYNRASNGGAISVVLGANHNNLPANVATDRLRISNTTFEGNFATNGLRVDENLAARNVGNTHFVNGQIGSALWLGPRTDVNGNVLAVELRNHIWNNYDVITRNWLDARNVNFNIIGTAAANSVMAARLTETRHSSNPTTTTVATATTAPTTHSLPQTIVNDDTVIRGSLTQFEITQRPWNSVVVHWVNTQTTRTFIPGNLFATPPTDGNFSVSSVPTTIANTTNLLSNIVVDQHTLVQPRIDYIYHNITFTIDPASPAINLGRLNDGGSNEPTIVRNLRRSRSAADHAGYTGVTPRGNPIGAPPAIVENSPWRFVEWRLGSPTGTVVTEAEIAAMYISGPLTFYAIFMDRWLVTFDPDGGYFPQGGGVYCDEPVVQDVVSGNLATVPTPPPVKDNYFFVGWYYDDDGELIEWNFDTPIDRDVNLIAVWTPAITEVTVSKRVSGSMADFGRYFSFTITFTCEDGLPLPSQTEIFYVISCGDASTCSAGCQCDFGQGLLGNPPTPRQVDLQNGTFSFWLRHMQSITFYDVPANAQILVVEGDYPLYITWIYVDGGTTPVNGNSFGPHVVVDALDGLTLQFNNDRGTIVQAGVIIGNTGITFILFGAVLTAALIAFVIISRRKKESM